MLIPPQHRTTPLAKSRGEVEVSLAEVQSLTGGAMEIEEASPFDSVLRSQQEACLSDMLYGLTEREETVIRLRFGFDGPALTYGQIAQRFRLSVERIRQIERKGLRKLRQKSHRGASAARIQELFGYAPLDEEQSGDAIRRLPMH